MAEANCWRMALTGSSKPAIITIVSTRCIASRVLLAWTVVIEPSWPVFMAWSMSSVSAPRHSPTTMRSGRIRRALISRSRMVIWPLPSMLAGRVSRRTTCGWRSLQFGGVLDGDDALVVRDERREVVQQRRLARARAADDQDVQAGLHAGLEEVHHLRRAGLEADVVVPGDRIAAEPPDGHARPVDRQRRNDRVDAGAVGESGVDHRADLVAAAADRADDLVDDVHQVGVVLELDVGQFQSSLAFDVDLPRAVDQDVADVRVGQEELQRSEAEGLVEDLADQALALGEVEDRLFLVAELGDEFANLLAGLVVVLSSNAGQVELVDELAVDPVLHLVELVHPLLVDPFFAGLRGYRGRGG